MRPFRGRSGLVPLLLGFALLTTPAQAQPQPNWQEAVAQLAQERTQAETCARVLKRYGTAEAIRRGAAAYDQARAEYDGVIAGLTVALARKAKPESLRNLQVRLQRGFDEREAFCRDAKALIPATVAGERGVIEQIVSGALKPLLDAALAIFNRTQDDNALTRATIQTQLEAARWPAFDSVPPSSL